MCSCAGASVLYTPFVLFAIVLGAFGIILVGAGLVSLFRLRVWRFTVRTLVGLLLVSLGTIAGGIALGVQGYQALTREDVAARISVQPSAPQQFSATVHYPDGRSRTFDLKGDEIYVDAHILKWKPIANLVGLHTGYELRPHGGPFQGAGAEGNPPPPVYLLRDERPVEL